MYTLKSQGCRKMSVVKDPVGTRTVFVRSGGENNKQTFVVNQIFKILALKIFRYVKRACFTPRELANVPAF